jgi:hypothetical protein
MRFFKRLHELEFMILRYNLNVKDTEIDRQIIEIAYIEKGDIFTQAVKEYSYFKNFDFNSRDFDRVNNEHGCIVATKGFKDAYKKLTSSIRGRFENQIVAMRCLGFD